MLYTAPVLAAGDTLTVMAQISYTSTQLATINYAPTPNEPVAFTIINSGPVVIQVSGEKPTTGPVQIGTGPDTFTLDISEDAYQGDAQFLISIDGKQYGGVQTATASHKAGESQPFVINGNFGRGWHTYSVNFLNDLDSQSDSTSRNLYVDSASYNGFSFPDSSLSLLTNGTASEGFDPLVITPPAIGSGLDSFTFILSEDAYQGDAQFVVTIDGQQQGSVQTATALHAAGQTQVVEVKGDFGAASDHTVVITFLNDAWGGSAAADRNLYVDLATFNDSILGITPFKGALFDDGSLSFVRPGTGADTLVVSLSEDAFEGDAQAKITLDGKVLGQVTVTALHAGTPQDFAFTGSFGPGGHVVGVTFLNDAWDGTDATDRNLYVGGVSLNGVAHPEATAGLFNAGTATFNV